MRISIVPAPKKAGEDQAIGRSRGGLSTKIHTVVDALGNPIGFVLTGGQVHDLVGADHLLPTMDADTLIADKAFDADKRVIEPLVQVGKAYVIPPKANRRILRHYDQDICIARHLIENFSPNSSSSALSQPATTRPPKISSAEFIWPPR